MPSQSKLAFHYQWPIPIPYLITLLLVHVNTYLCRDFIWLYLELFSAPFHCKLIGLLMIRWQLNGDIIQIKLQNKKVPFTTNVKKNIEYDKHTFIFTPPPPSLFSRLSEADCVVRKLNSNPLWTDTSWYGYNTSGSLITVRGDSTHGRPNSVLHNYKHLIWNVDLCSLTFHVINT